MAAFPTGHLQPRVAEGGVGEPHFHGEATLSCPRLVGLHSRWSGRSGTVSSESSIDFHFKPP